MQLKLLSLNIALPKVIAHEDGEEILSGIDKRPVAGGTLFLSATGLDGDGQADLENHGGLEKAVYAYPVENWPWWEREHALSCKPATFGENLTLSGADETQVRIGDRFAWGDAELEISQPRAPCFKLGIHAGRAQIPQIMTLSARCGWYFRVVTEGDVPAVGVLKRVYESDSPTVRETFATIFSAAPDMAQLQRVHATAALTPSWRKRAAKKLGGSGA